MARFIPEGARHTSRGWRGRWCCLAALLALGTGPAPLSAQGVEPETFYVSRRTFNIPFKMDPLDRRTQEVRLNVSVDSGQSYQHVATARPSAEKFLFQAQGDGWYWFAVQTSDGTGMLTPPDVRAMPPSMKVCVDTVPPRINLKAVPAADGSPAAIQWAIQDENFDDLRADYRAAGAGDWVPLVLPRSATGVYGWRPAVAGLLEVRVQARDKASNMAEQRVSLTPGPGRPGAPADPAGAGGVQHVKSTTFLLKYSIDKDSIGPSNVESVDVWVWRQGAGWRKLPTKSTPEAGAGRPGVPPQQVVEGVCTVKVDGPGRWGFKLIPKSGVGLAEPEPQPNEVPRIWVEVDQQAPQVMVTNVVVSPGTDPGKVTVYWTASDPYLGERPINIFYRQNSEGPWLEVPDAKNLPNSGIHTFAPPNGLWQFYLRVTAVDEAGNVGENVWRQVVKVDLKVPRISEVKVSATDAPPEPPPPGGQPPFNPGGQQFNRGGH